MPHAHAMTTPELHPVQAMLAAEMRLSEGPVPRVLDGVAVPDECYVMRGDRFLVRAAGGFGLLYARGEGITLEQPAGVDPRDVALWLNGTIYAAVAAMNGLMPLHASAVAHSGRVFAFTGPPGAGKSTLAAALGRSGLPLFCDDTLILDLSSPGAVLCLPGHKQLKLWPEGVELAGARPLDLVSDQYPKHFATPPAGVVGEPLPLAELIFLEQGVAPALESVPPGERIARLQDDHYTARLFEQAGRLPLAERFAQLAGIAARMPMRRFARPFATNRFDEGLAYMTDHIRGQGQA